MRRLFIFIVTLLSLTACYTTKNLPEDEVHLKIALRKQTRRMLHIMKLPRKKSRLP